MSRYPPRAERSYRSRFPTREAAIAFASVDPKFKNLVPGKLYRFILGADDEIGPRLMTTDEVERWIGDPFGRRLLRRGVFPNTLDELLARLDALPAEDALPKERSFLVGDGSQIPWSEATKEVDRQLRFVVTRGAGDDTAILISTALAPGDPDVFLQVASWDPDREEYSFYQRRERAWVWSGSSSHALAPGTRGRGPFDSHVNGGLVMKERKAPWLHWDSMVARIDAAIAPDDLVRDHRLFRNREGAQILQVQVVEPGIRRWNRARLRRTIGADGEVRDVPYLLRQVLETTSVNLASMDVLSRAVRDQDELEIPPTLFLNADALLNVIGIDADVPPVLCSGRDYNHSLRRHGLQVADGKGYIQPGDAHFAFVVPEPAFEDVDALDHALELRLLDRRLAACLIMVDFPNAIYSKRRASLMRYVPPDACFDAGACDLGRVLVGRIETAARSLPPDSAEVEFMDYWALGVDGWRRTMGERIGAYFSKITRRAATAEGFDQYVRLAESRRRRFRKLPLSEFTLTLPLATKIPADDDDLEMREDGSVGRP